MLGELGFGLMIVGVLYFLIVLVFGILSIDAILVLYIIHKTFEVIGLFFIIIYDYFAISRKDKKSGYTQKLIREERLKKQAQQRRIEQAEREVVIGTMNFVAKMRVHYPRADESLFQEAMKELPKNECRKTLEDYEKMIKKSHLYNLSNKPLFNSTRTYTLKDVESLTPIEVRNEFPLKMTLYQIEKDYVLWISNAQTYENTLLQTQNYFLMADYMITILELQQNLRKLKESVRSIQLESIFNVKKQSANDYNATN